MYEGQLDDLSSETIDPKGSDGTTLGDSEIGSSQRDRSRHIEREGMLTARREN